MKLAIPRGMIMWEVRGLTSIINLTFISQLLQQRLVKYIINMVLDHGSNYFFILLKFELYLAKAELQLSRAQKKADFELVVIIITQKLLFSGKLTTLDRINIYSDYLVDFTQRLVDLAVPQTKPSGFSVPWQTREIITWKTQGLTSIIDLAFTSQLL